MPIGYNGFMNKNLWIVTGVLILIVFGAGFFLFSKQTLKQEPTSKDKQTISESIENTSPTPKPQGTVNEIKIYLTAIDDNGKSGEMIGCGDSVVPVVRSIASTTAPLSAALSELLNLKGQYYGQSGLYNALYQSNLKLDKATVQNGTAIINLSGNLLLGGVCDDPRVEAQLTQTVLQFSTVKSADIYINNKPLKEVLSEK